MTWTDPSMSYILPKVRPPILLFFQDLIWTKAIFTNLRDSEPKRNFINQSNTITNYLPKLKL